MNELKKQMKIFAGFVVDKCRRYEYSEDIRITYVNLKGVISMQISNAEWQVMRVIWSKEQTTSKEITHLLQDKLHWTASTVKTLLTRLVAKKFVTTEKLGNRFLYRPLITEEASVLAMSQEVSEKVCTKKIPLVIMDLIQQNDLTAADIADLMEALQAKEVVTTTACHCLPGNHQC